MPQNSMKKKKRPMNPIEKKPTVKVVDQYHDLFTMKQVPVSDAFIDRFFSEMLNSAINDQEMLTIRSYFLTKGVTPDAYYRWVKNFPQAKRAHEAALMIIGDRRERGGLTRKYDAGLVRYSMPQYSYEWKDTAEWYEGLKEKERDKGGNITVVMTPFEEYESTIDTKSESNTLRLSQSTPEEVAQEAKRKTVRKNG